MKLLATNDWSAIITAATPVLVALFGAIVTVYLKSIEKKATDAAIAVDEVKATLVETTAIHDKKLDGIATVTDKTHTLVNSAMTVQLQINAKVTRQLAVVTKDPAHIKAAEDAEALLADHINLSKTQPPE